MLAQRTIYMLMAYGEKEYFWEISSSGKYLLYGRFPHGALFPMANQAGYNSLEEIRTVARADIVHRKEMK